MSKGLASKRWMPEAGDLVWIDLNPRTGHEQSGVRPALVVSEAAYNARSRLCLICPITSHAKGYPFEVPLPRGSGVNGVILSDHLKSVDFKARHAKRVASAPASVLNAVRAYIALLIGAK